MSKRAYRKSVPVLFLGAVVAVCGCRSLEHHPALEVGVAAVDITPGDKPALDPLQAKAIVLRQGREQAALVICDVIGISGEVSAQVRTRAAREIGMARENICIAATHTHSGGYRDDLADRIVSAIRQAHAARKPAQLLPGTAQREGLSFHRRFLMKDGTVRFNPGYAPNTPSFDGGQYPLNPDIVRPVGPIDPQVGYIFFRGMEAGQTFGSVMSFSLHACTCPGPSYSADFPGWLAEKMKARFGEGFVSLFAAGPCGDINHIDPAKPWPPFSQSAHRDQYTKPIGEGLAQAVLQDSEQARGEEPCLAVRCVTVRVPLASYSEMDLAWAREAKANKFRDFPGTAYNERGFLAGIRAERILRLERLHREMGDAWPLEVQVFRLSRQTAIVALPGEIFVELGLALKQASPFAHTLVVELANESKCLYVPTGKAFSEGGYEVVNSSLAPGGGEMLVAEAVRMLKELKPD